jgi:AsmA-like protein
MVDSKNQKKSSLKFWLIPVYCIFTLLFVFVLLVTFIDLDRFHEPLASRLSKATGWNVQMESLNLDFTHGLGVKCGGLRVRSKDESRDLFFAEKLYLVAELRPLLKRQLKFKQATIVQPVIKIYSESTAQILPSVPAPTETIESQQAPEKHSEFPTPELPPVSETQVPFEDQIPEKHSEKNMGLKKFKEILKNTNLSLQIIEIRQGKVVLIDPSSKSSHGQEVPINVSLRMEFEQHSPQRVDAIIDSLELGIDDLLFQGSARVEDLLTTLPRINADLKSDSITIPEIRPIEKLVPDFKFPKELGKGNIEHVSIHLDAPLSTMDTLDVLKQKARLDFSLRIKDAVYRKNDWSILLPQLIGEGTWENNLLTQNIHGEILGGTFQEKGVVQFPKTPQGARTFFLDSEVNFSGLDLTLPNYPRKEEWIPLQGKADGSFKIKGPVNLSEKGAEFDRLHWNGTVTGENLVFANQDSLQQVARATLVIKEETLALTTPIEFEFEGIKIEDIPFKKAKGIFHIKPNTVQLIDGKIWPQNGEIQLAGNYNLQEKIVALDITGEKLLAKDFIQLKDSAIEEVPINVSLRLETKRLSPKRMDAVVDPLRFDIEDLLLQGSLRVEDLLASKSKVKANLKSRPISLSQLKGLGKFLPDFQFPKVLEKGHIEHLSLSLDAPLQKMRDLNSLRENSLVEFSLKIKDTVYHSGDWEIFLPQLHGEGTLKNNLWNGTLKGENLVLKNQDSLQQVARATLLVQEENLTLTTPVEFELEGIKIHDIPFKKAKGIFHIKPNTVQLFDGKIWPQSGEIQLAGNYDLQEKIVALDIKGEKLLAKDFIQWKDTGTPEVPFNVSLRLETKRPGPERLDAVIRSIQLGIKDLFFHGTIRVEDILASQSYVKAELKSDPTTFSRIRRMANVFQNFKVPQELEKGNIEHISIHLDAPLPTMNNLEALKERAQLDFTFKIKDAIYRHNDWSILFPRLIGEGTWENNLLTQQLHGEIFDGKFQEKGVVRFPKTPQGVGTIFLDSEVTLSGLDLALPNYPRKEDWIPSQGKADGSFKIKGPVTLSEKGAWLDRLHWNGTFKGENLVLESQDSLQQAGRVNIIIKEGTSALTPLEVHIDQLKIQDIALKKAKGFFHVKPEALELIEGTIWPEHGELQLAGTYSMDRDSYSLDIQGKNLRAEDLSQNALNGPARFSGKFKGRMTPEKSSQKTEYDHFIHGLSGIFHINTSNGTIQELGDLETLLTALNLTTSINKKENGVEYKFIGGDFKILKGLLVTDNFIIDGPQLKMSIVGKAKLPDGKVDAEITAMPLQMLDSLVKVVPLLGDLLTGGKKGGLLVTHCKVTGTLENPEFKLQPHKSATKKPTDIFKGITNLPKGLIDLEKNENSKAKEKN